MGVNRSEPFLSRARTSSAAGEEYVAADVAVLPLQITGIGEQPDLIYARFLASHLESISTEVAVFDEYLKIVSGIPAQHGNELFVGARRATTRWDDDLRIEVNRAAEVRPSTGQAARMFSMNLPSWRRLAAELDGLTGSAETGRIVWQMRQISLRRHPA